MRLIAKVLPVVIGAAVAKAGLELAGVRLIELNALLSGIVAANVFLLGFLLAGTLADFKESERLPGEMAAALDSIADEALLISVQRQDPAALGCLAHLRDLNLGIRQWLCDRSSFDEVLGRVRRLSSHFLALAPSTETTFVSRLKTEQAGLRRALIRVDAIRGTSFVGAGYLIASVTTGLLLVALLLADIGPAGQAAFFVGIIAFLLVYMNLLIRDLDNPFDYTDGSAEVSLEPLRALERRLAEAIAGAGAAAEAAQHGEGAIGVPEPA